MTISRVGGSKRVLCVALIALFAVSAACSSDAKTPAATGSNSGGSAASSGGDVLGTFKPVTGAPVKIGLISDGGDCAACAGSASGDDAPAAQAAAKWANDYLNGIAGRPIELDVCIDDQDPGKASDCANQMIRDQAQAVVIGASSTIDSSWGVLHAAGIPVVNFSATNTALLADSASTFILQDPQAATVTLPLGVAKKTGADRVSTIIVDLPIATDIWGGDTPGNFQKEGVTLDLVPVALGTPDMTPQAQQVVSKNPNGVVMIVGHDQFCIPAINGLTAAGFKGSIVTIQQCVTDAMRAAIPSEILKGIVLSAVAPITNTNDPSIQQYFAALDKYGASSVRRDQVTPLQVFSSVAALSVGTKNLQGDVTPASIIAALKSMSNEVLPATGGRYFRCNGKASKNNPAICMSSILSATLDDKGQPVSYDVVNNDQIPD